MKCEIKCGVPKKNPLRLKKHGTAAEKEVTWLTKDEGVTYCVKVPPGIFTACLIGIGCEYRVKDGLSVTLTLAPGAPPLSYTYSITVCEGKLPAGCPGRPLVTPEIIVSDDKKKKVKPAAVKKAAPKKKAK